MPASLQSFSRAARLEPPPPEDPSILAFPRDDALFRRAVDRQVAATGSRGDVRAARRELRRTYPEADLHRQRDVTLDGERRELWFAFRDGRLTPAMPSERWWEASATATCDLDRGGTLGAANPKARSLLGLPPGRGTIPPLTNLVSGYLAAQLTDRQGGLGTTGQVTSVFAVQRPWGGAERIEVHAQRDGGGTSGSHRLSFRSMGERDDDNEQSAVRKGPLGLAARGARQAALRGRSRRTLEPGERLSEGIAGEPWVVLVAAGTVRVYLSLEDSEPTLLYGTAGGLLGTRLLAIGEVVLGLEAVTPSIVLQLDAKRIDRLIETDATFARAVLAEGRGVAGDLALSYASAVATSLPERLAREIVVLADLHPDEPYLAVTEQQLADGIGTIRESVGRSIADFRRRSWLATTRYGLIVRDLPALRRRAKLPVTPKAPTAPTIPTAPPAPAATADARAADARAADARAADARATRAVRPARASRGIEARSG
jgi:CRP-like cAMP-binding protein